VAVANAIGSGHTALGLREIGRAQYDEFADSLDGQVILGLLRHNADRVSGQGVKAWNMAGIPSRVHSESIEERNYRYHFENYPAELVETVSIGVLEGALHSCGEVSRLSYARADLMRSVIDIRWG